MNNSLLIRLSAITAGASLIVLASTAGAARLPRPLGAGEQPLSAGVHVLDLVSREQGRKGYTHLPRIAITLPSGWFNYNGWGLNDGDRLSVSFWDVDKVYPTGCRWQGKPKIDPGRTVDGLARVLATRPLRHASRPTNVALAGFRGKYLRWSVPSKIDISSCTQGYFESWTGRGWATDRWQQGAGQVDRLWILDVHGKRLVIDANYLPTTRADRTEVDRIVHSIKFLSVPTRKPASAASATDFNTKIVECQPQVLSASLDALGLSDASLFGPRPATAQGPFGAARPIQESFRREAGNRNGRVVSDAAQKEKK